jgi:hypothetical protein
LRWRRPDIVMLRCINSKCVSAYSRTEVPMNIININKIK